MMPAVPTTVSMMMAAIVAGPSIWMTSARCSSARCDSCSGLVA